MNILKTLRDWQTVRQTRNELNSLSNRELIDLGISRADIDAISRGVNVL